MTVTVTLPIMNQPKTQPRDLFQEHHEILEAGFIQKLLVIILDTTGSMAGAIEGCLNGASTMMALAIASGYHVSVVAFKDIESNVEYHAEALLHPDGYAKTVTALMPTQDYTEMTKFLSELKAVNVIHGAGYRNGYAGSVSSAEAVRAALHKAAEIHLDSGSIDTRIMIITDDIGHGQNDLSLDTRNDYPHENEYIQTKLGIMPMTWPDLVQKLQSDHVRLIAVMTHAMSGSVLENHKRYQATYRFFYESRMPMVGLHEKASSGDRINLENMILESMQILIDENVKPESAKAKAWLSWPTIRGEKSQDAFKWHLLSSNLSVELPASIQEMFRNTTTDAKMASAIRDQLKAGQFQSVQAFLALCQTGKTAAIFEISALAKVYAVMINYNKRLPKANKNADISRLEQNILRWAAASTGHHRDLYDAWKAASVDNAQTVAELMKCNPDETHFVIYNGSGNGVNIKDLLEALVRSNMSGLNRLCEIVAGFQVVTVAELTQMREKSPDLLAVPYHHESAMSVLLSLLPGDTVHGKCWLSTRPSIVLALILVKVNHSSLADLARSYLTQNRGYLIADTDGGISNTTFSVTMVRFLTAVLAKNDGRSNRDLFTEDEIAFLNYCNNLISFMNARTKMVELLVRFGPKMMRIIQKMAELMPRCGRCERPTALNLVARWVKRPETVTAAADAGSSPVDLSTATVICWCCENEPETVSSETIEKFSVLHTCKCCGGVYQILNAEKFSGISGHCHQCRAQNKQKLAGAVVTATPATIANCRSCSLSTVVSNSISDDAGFASVCLQCRADSNSANSSTSVQVPALKLLLDNDARLKYDKIMPFMRMLEASMHSGCNVSLGDFAKTVSGTGVRTDASTGLLPGDFTGPLSDGTYEPCFTSIQGYPKLTSEQIQKIAENCRDLSDRTCCDICFGNAANKKLCGNMSCGAVVCNDCYDGWYKQSAGSLFKESKCRCPYCQHLHIVSYPGMRASIRDIIKSGKLNLNWFVWCRHCNRLEEVGPHECSNGEPDVSNYKCSLDQVWDVNDRYVDCPGCNMSVQKDGDACNHMTCACGYEFCWNCGDKFTGYDHFGSDYYAKCPMYGTRSGVQSANVHGVTDETAEDGQ